MKIYIAYIYSAETGSYLDNFIFKESSRTSAWDKALRMVFGESLFSIGKMVMLYDVDDPF